jgi:hypothetical protein
LGTGSSSSWRTMALASHPRTSRTCSSASRSLATALGGESGSGLGLAIVRQLTEAHGRHGERHDAGIGRDPDDGLAPFCAAGRRVGGWARP